MQTDLAKRCGFDNASLSRIEAGKKNMTIMTLKKICDALEVPVGDVL